MKTAPLSIAASLTLLAAPLLHSAEPAKKPTKATPAAAKATPVAKAAPAPEPGKAPAGEPGKVAYPEVVAVVEGKEIKAAELQEAVSSFLAQRGVQPDDVPEEKRSEVFHGILDQMIMSKIVEKRSADLKVPEAEVTGEIDKIKAQIGTEEEFNKQLAASGQTLDSVKENIRGHLRQQRWVESQVKDGKKVTDADAEEYYKKNPDDFKQPEEVRASHILIAVPQDAKPEVVIEKQKAAEAAAARVKGGEDFAKVAKELSEDPGSKETGGDLNFFTKDKMVPEFANAAFALKKDAISNPVRSQFGYHIIKVTDRKDSEALKLEDVKPKLVAYLQAQEQKKATAKMLQDLRAGAEVKVNLP
ncbi:MAG TPA: peptidylprolyl isomerase [Chthoniobacteraceae bacterium]|jgi:peptidyl-prolyl cis-trans isomerase C|nr:peptidylprolyl isomerase [Chthoniobacteraceae bacterium]